MSAEVTNLSLVAQNENFGQNVGLTDDSNQRTSALNGSEELSTSYSSDLESHDELNDTLDANDPLVLTALRKEGAFMFDLSSSRPSSPMKSLCTVFDTSAHSPQKPEQLLERSESPLQFAPPPLKRTQPARWGLPRQQIKNSSSRIVKNGDSTPTKDEPILQDDVSRKEKHPLTAVADGQIPPPLVHRNSGSKKRSGRIVLEKNGSSDESSPPTKRAKKKVQWADEQIKD